MSSPSATPSTLSAGSRAVQEAPRPCACSSHAWRTAGKPAAVHSAIRSAMASATIPSAASGAGGSRTAARLAAGNSVPSGAEAIALLAEAFARWTAVWDADGFPAVADAWTARADLGGRVSARLPAETLEGVAEALDHDGALRLRLDDGAVRRITAGDVFPLTSSARAA